MTKSELITIIHSQFTRLTQQDVDVSVKLILGSMSEALSRSDRIKVRDLGSFKLNIRPPRSARNPKTGEKVLVPQRGAPHFKPSVELRDRVNKI